jgi:hypothetical protein
MVRRVSISQYNSMMRQRQREINRAVDKVNRAERQRVSKHNAVVRTYNADVRRVNQKRKDAVSQYNRYVNNFNAQVRSNRAKLSQLAISLNSSTSTRYDGVRTSTVDLIQRFDRVADEDFLSDEHSEIVHLAQIESSNSAQVAEKFLHEEPLDDQVEAEATGILEYLGDLSPDLLDRWRGAMFSLSPNNPDAGRHFCTSAREIFTEILEKWAEDEEVIAANPDCQRTPNGSKPTRRAKISYLLTRKNAATNELISFVEADIENVVRLFDDFNEGTHGPAGRFGFTRLQTIRRRVEGGIMFLATIAA